jgi:hypothetical protein
MYGEFLSFFKRPGRTQLHVIGLHARRPCDAQLRCWALWFVQNAERMVFPVQACAELLRTARWEPCWPLLVPCGMEGLRPVSGVVCKLTRDFWQSDMTETGNSWLDSLHSFIEGCSCAGAQGRYLAPPGSLGTDAHVKQDAPSQAAARVPAPSAPHGRVLGRDRS